MFNVRLPEGSVTMRIKGNVGPRRGVGFCARTVSHITTWTEPSLGSAKVNQRIGSQKAC